MKYGALNEATIDALRMLEDESGRLTADAVVEEATNPKSVLHDRFQWDDTLAAHAHRIEQARALIRSVKIHVVEETVTVSTVHYIRDPDADENEQGYLSLDRLAEDHDKARLAIRREFRMADAAMQRAEGIAEALEMRGVIIKARKALGAARKKIERTSA